MRAVLPSLPHERKRVRRAKFRVRYGKKRAQIHYAAMKQMREKGDARWY